MKKQILNTILSLCMTMTMVLSLLPLQAMAQELTHLSHAPEQDAAQSVAPQNIGPNEAAVETDLYEKMSAQVSTITLISDIELNGALRIDYAVTIDLNGHALKMSEIASGRVISVENGGHLTIIDSDPTAEHKFTPNADGLWVLDEANGTKTVKGGVITGGGVKIECETDLDSGIISNGTFTMNGGAIIGCVASHGGAEINGGSGGEYGTFTMNGGVIDSCVAADGMGGGVKNDGLFIMGKDATIKNCKAVEDGQYYFGGGVSLSGDRQILDGEIVSGDANDKDYIYVSRGTVTIGANAKIQANISFSNGTIALADGVTSATVYGKITNGCFADGLVTVTYQVGGTDYAAQILQSSGTATRPADPTSSTGGGFLGWYRADGTAYDFTQPVTENITLTARFAAVTRGVDTKEALIAALANVDVDVVQLAANGISPWGNAARTLYVGRAVTLDLNGYVLKGNSSSVFEIENGGHLTVIDSNPTAEHKFWVDNNYSYGVWRWNNESGDKTAYGGVINGGYTSNGGGVKVLEGGKLTMNGGSMVGCSSTRRSATGEPVDSGINSRSNDLNKLAVITLNGGLIKNIGQYGIYDMYGTTIYANGGEVYGEFYVGQTSKVTSLPGHTGVTVFRGRTVIDGASGANVSHIDWGIYYGEMYFADDGRNITTGLIVTYMIDDVEYAKQVLPSGTLAMRPDDPTKLGYIFNGWYTADGAQWNYATDTVTENVTLTAKWNVKTAEVKTAEELENALADDSVGQIRLVEDITLDGNTVIKVTEGRQVIFDLNGHVLDLAGKYISVSATSMGEGGTNIYPNQLTIIDSNPDAPHKFTPNADGLWVLDETGGTETVLGGVITGGSTTFSGLIINNNAQAQFDGVHSPLGIVGEKPTGVNDSYCAVTFDTADGTMEYTTRYFLQGKNISDEIKPDPRTGYTFDGWYKADGTAWDYASDKVTGDVTLYAKWTPKTYTVTFDTAGGLDIATKTMTATYGKALANMPVPRREGYVFLGWYDAMVGGKCYGNSDGNGTDAYDKDGNITLYAQWMEAPDCTVRFETDGGTMTDPAEVRHKINTPIAKPSDPTKAGYTFTGWYTDLTYTQLWNFDDWVTGEMMLYAGWNVNRYTITFDTAGGSKIDSITQDYGTTITAPANPTREGYTFVGWDKEIPATMLAENVTITAKWKVNQYKITFDTAGGSKIDSITQDYGTAITAPTDPTREGYTFVGWDKEIPVTMPAENMTLKARWKDSEKPTGEIIIGTNKWSDFLNELTSGLFFKDPQEVTINAADNGGIVLASYLVTDQDISEAELKSLVYRAYEDPFRIEPNGEYIIYVMLVDESMNITYLRSDRITPDNIQPVISGIKDGKTYCEAQTVTIDEKYIDTVTINGIAVTLDENNSFILAPADGEQKIVVIDKAGNKAEMTVTVNGGHTLLADDGDCTTPVYCKICNAEVIVGKSHRFTGNWQNDEADHWHICQNENCTVTDTKTAHSGDDDGNCLTAVVCECGYVITAAKPAHTFNKWASNGNDTHTRKCTVVGCNGIEAEGCSGGKATCTEQAVCTVCHTEYGDTLGHNFTISQHDETHHWNKCSRCNATDTKADHTGGTATCTDKAECEVCHEKYGEPDANHHTELEAVDAVPATAASTGTVAHWRCTACGRLFDDADGKHEISFEDTVTKKLAPSILDGANSEWRKGNENGLTFSSDAAFSDFVEVLVDGKTVASENYAKQEGGIIVELKASYLETLAEGEHILTIRSANGDATTGFTIAASDSTNAWVWIIICFIALGIGVTVAVFVVRKRKTA